MAQQIEPMDIDSSVCDFDNKENSFHLNNVLSRTPCTEKGYEELDVSELNMKLRYSMTPANSPMSKSYTANCIDNRNIEPESTITCENGNMSRSLHSTLKNDSVIKSQKVLPLQVISAEQGQIDGNRNALRSLDTTVDSNITVTVSSPNDIDENLSLPSSSSSLTHTPEATTPTKDIPRDGGSPIMRGLKSVLNMFRPSQSPIPPEEEDKADALSPPIIISPDKSERAQVVSASTPVGGQKTKDPLSKNANRDSIVFNEDLEKELQWKDDSTIIFSKEKIPIHKLFFQTEPESKVETPQIEKNKQNLDTTVEYMDISYNDSGVMDKTVANTSTGTLNKSQIVNPDSDGEFLDCESTFSKNESLKEQSFESLMTMPIENANLDVSPTKTVSANQSVNVSNETVTALNLSQASTTTTSDDKLDTLKTEVNFDSEVATPKQENFNTLEPTATIEETATVTSVNQNIEIDPLSQFENLSKDMNNTFECIGNNTQINTIAEINDLNVNKTPVPDNVVGSLAQIPLIVDPRILLFNIPPEVKTGKNEVSDDVYIISPADMPLPDDDEDLFASLPSVANVTDQEVATARTKNENVELTEIPNHEENSMEKQDKTDITITDKEVPSEMTDKVNFSIFEQTLNTTVTTEGDIIKNIDNLIKEMSQENIVVASPQLHDVEPMDVSICEPKINRILHKEMTENNDACISDVEAIPVQVTQNNDFRHLTTNHVEDEVVSGTTENIPTRNDKTEFTVEEKVAASEVPKEIVEHIRQEVEAIVKAALDIVADKSGESKDIINVQSVNETIIPVLNSTKKIDSIDVGISPPKVREKLPFNIEEIPNISEPNTGLEFTVEDVKDASTTDKIKEDQFLESTLKDLEVTVVQDKILPGIETNTQVAEVITDAIALQVKLPENIDLIPEANKTDLFNDPINIKDQEPLQNFNPNTKNSNENKTVELEIEIPPIMETLDISANDAKSILDKIENMDEEIVASENNSPFVSVSAENEHSEENHLERFEEIEIPFAKNNNVTVSPPLSPKIVSKGYNLNFDEIEDPFATQTKVRLSPPPGGSSNSTFEKLEDREPPKRDINRNNRRKSQPERRKPVNTKKLNSTFAGKCNIENKTIRKLETELLSSTTEQKSIVLNNKPEEIDSVPAIRENVELKNQEDVVITEIETNVCTATEPVNITPETDTLKADSKTTSNFTIPTSSKSQTSSSGKSEYDSPVTSSTDIIISKNSFNLPEIDDPNFNPFASRSKVCQSPPLDATFSPFSTKSKIVASPPCSLEPTDPFSSKCKIASSPEQSIVIHQNTDKLTTVDVRIASEVTSTVNEAIEVTEVRDEKDLSNNSNATVKTEDADTLEGPFLEAEDNNDDKMSDVDEANVDMMQFSDLPPGHEEQTEAGELFIDADAFEFLLNQNQANTVADSGKESLFLKFDPLFAKRMSSDGVLSALNKLQKRGSTPKKVIQPDIDTTFDKSPVPGPSKMNVTQDNTSIATDDSYDDLNVTVSKPMMVVNPAVNPIVTPRNKSTTPVRSNRQSLTFTSPAIAVIDRLLCMSANNSLVHDNTFAEVRRDNEADLALTQLRELLADKEISVYNLRSESKELKDRLAILESQMKSLEAISEERLKKINELNEKLVEKSQINKSMAKVVEEYERTIASLIAETEQDKKRHAEERIQLIRERDEQTAHLASMEVSFSDLHSKYEKSKQVILGFKANEDTYKKSIKEFEENLVKMQNNYELLKQHATSKLNHANEELQKINRSHEAEVLKLNALIKRKEMHITSLEETLQQKTKANEELTAICDELINKVG